MFVNDDGEPMLRSDHLDDDEETEPFFEDEDFR